MARIRTIKPDIWDDEAFGEINLEAQLLFIGLITQADDEGRQKTTAQRLSARLWPYKPDVGPKRVGVWLDALENSGLIVRYEVAKKQFIYLPTWLNHQRVSRPTQSLHPVPPRNTKHQIKVLMSPHGALTESSLSPPNNSGALRAEEEEE